MAQERILLVEEGDILDAKIRKAEKEIEAMENTLKVVNVSNDNYRNRLTIIDPEGKFVMMHFFGGGGCVDFTDHLH